MITGKAGHKQIAHAELLLSSRKVSQATLKRRGMSELANGLRSIESSYVSGLKDYERAVRAVQKARTQLQKQAAQTRLREVNSRLNQLTARKKKARALVGRIKQL